MSQGGRELPLSRRDLLRTAAATGLASTVTGAGELLSTPRQSDLIRAENEKPGTRDWMITHSRVEPATKYRCPWIEGYASRTSVRAGETIKFHISANPASAYNVAFYRLGYYQGHGGRHVHSFPTLFAQPEPDPPVAEKRLRECRWEWSDLTIPGDWTSGVYLAKLSTLHHQPPTQSYIIFIVRDDRRADFLFQCSDHTWNAYNRWPSQYSLYDDGEKVWYWGPDVQVSFDRPYGKYCQILDAPLSVGSGEFLLWEFPLAYWMEKEGYDVTYISNTDTHLDAAGLLRGRAFLSVGHDEYWSLDMYNNVQSAVAAGVNVAFLSGNALCGLVDVHPSSDGRPGRIIERVGLFGGHDDTEDGFPEMKRLMRAAPSEALLIGARNKYPVTGGGDWICRKPGHWLFAGTGMREGDGIPGLVGWEWHAEPAEIPGIDVVASGPTNNNSVEGHYDATIYPGPKGNWVFNAATIWWSDGLSEPPGYVRPDIYKHTKPRGPDPRVQRITRNLFARFLDQT
jgi:hypothetical protein